LKSSSRSAAASELNCSSGRPVMKRSLLDAEAVAGEREEEGDDDDDDDDEEEEEEGDDAGSRGGASSGPDAPHTISFVVTPEPATAGSTPEEPSFASVEDAPPSSEDVVNVGEGGDGRRGHADELAARRRRGRGSRIDVANGWINAPAREGRTGRREDARGANGSSADADLARALRAPREAPKRRRRDPGGGEGRHRGRARGTTGGRWGSESTRSPVSPATVRNVP